jgi:hypothetical protein
VLRPDESRSDTVWKNGDRRYLRKSGGKAGGQACCLPKRSRMSRALDPGTRLRRPPFHPLSFGTGLRSVRAGGRIGRSLVGRGSRSRQFPVGPAMLFIGAGGRGCALRSWNLFALLSTLLCPVLARVEAVRTVPPGRFKGSCSSPCARGRASACAVRRSALCGQRRLARVEGVSHVRCAVVSAPLCQVDRDVGSCAWKGRCLCSAAVAFRDSGRFHDGPDKETVMVYADSVDCHDLR